MGPVTGGQRGWLLSLPLIDLASVGYLAEEFFVSAPHMTPYMVSIVP